MIVTRHVINSCCGKTSIVFKIDRPLSKIHLEKLVSFGFVEQKHFTVAGIFYADNPEFIVKGPFGSDRLQVTCKTANCDKNLNDLEELLTQLE